MMKTWKILALDIASVTGWCTEVSHGFWNFRPKKDESKGMRVVRFHSKVSEMISEHGINIIYFEMAAGRHANSIAVESEMIGVLKLLCEKMGVEYKSITSSAIKKHATGKGNAGKDLMVQAAKDKLGFTGEDDNEADAMWIYDFAKLELGL